MHSSSLRRALVTGGARGIGKAVVAGLVERAGESLEVIIAGRDRAAGEAVACVLPHGSFRPLDLADPESVDDFVRGVRSENVELDIVVNNAGATFEGFDAGVARRTLEVNFVGMMRLTDGLLPLLRPGARVVMMSSGMGALSAISPALQSEVMAPSLDRDGLLAFTDRFVADVARGDHQARGWPSNAYRVSKIAMNAYVRILARELSLDPRKVLVNATDPGWVRTAMGGSGAPRSPEEGADTAVWLATLPEGGPSGGLFRDRHAVDW